MEVFDKDGNFDLPQRISVIDSFRLNDPEIDEKLAAYESEVEF